MEGSIEEQFAVLAKDFEAVKEKVSQHLPIADLGDIRAAVASLEDRLAAIEARLQELHDIAVGPQCPVGQ